jgi:predicted pyridoxine 5'-phosphate oxidase superfamily flavin-nucleotide-binding protein
MFQPQSRALQDQFDTRRIADRIVDVLVSDTVNRDAAVFIEARDMFFLATADQDGRPTCSYKGGDPGFVRVVDERTLAFPNYDGNGMYLSMGNIAANPEVGLLFIDFVKGNRLRVQGRAAVRLEDPLLSDYDGAQFVVRVHVTQVFPNCPRYIHRYELVRRSKFTPRPDRATPVPDWKRADWACDYLPEDDPARA